MGAPDPLLGRKIAGKVVLESLIGKGAMGAVYKARHLSLDTIVAVKVMHDDMATDATFVERFHREARAASRLDHPNVIRVVDFGMEPDGLLYTVMDYVDGLDLFQIMGRDWPMPSQRIVELLSQTLGAMAVAHDVGIVHRDLKPENIMVSPRTDDEGRTIDAVTVCDFGIAQIAESLRPNVKGAEGAEGGRTLTTRGSLLGTPQYMSPEQCRGEELDAGSDLYSVGVILYQLLAGCLPFQAENPIDVVVKHLSLEPVPPTEHNPHASRGLEAVCLKALQKNRADRYATAREMRAALRDALGSDVAEVTRPRAPGGLVIGDPAMTEPALSAPSPLPTDLPTLPSVRPAAAGTATPAKQAPRRRLVSVALLGLVVGGVALFTARGRGGPSAAPPPQPKGESMKLSNVRAAEVAPAPPPSALDEAVPLATQEPGRAPAIRKSVAARRTSTALFAPEPGNALAAKSDGPKPMVVDPPVSPSSAPPSLPVVVGAAIQHPPSPAPSPPVDANKGRVAWSVAAVGGGATSGGFSRALARAGSAWTGCYQTALRAQTRALEGTAQLHLTCDDEGRVVNAALSGAATPNVAQCIRAASVGLKIPNADTGEAWATVALTFEIAK